MLRIKIIKQICSLKLSQRWILNEYYTFKQFQYKEILGAYVYTLS